MKGRGEVKNGEEEGLWQRGKGEIKGERKKAWRYM
jgi:hypothetical protein